MGMAKCWLEAQPDPPEEFIKTIQSHRDFSIFETTHAYPEFNSKFDNYGNGRNHDLLIVGTINGDKVVVGIEGKVDEEFGPTVQNRYQKALDKREAGELTNAPERIEGLIMSLFNSSQTKSVFELRYQLLHSVTGELLAP